MKISVVFFLFIIFLIGPPLAQAASFDCSAAESTTEKNICGSAKLSSLDDYLAELYKQYFSMTADQAALRVEQRRWLKEERDICTTQQCYESAYIERIQYLADKTGNLEGKGVCEVVADYANRNILPVLLVRPLSNNKVAHKALFRTDAPKWDLWNTWKITIEGSKSPIYVGERHGDQLYPNLYVRSSIGGKLTLIEGDSETSGDANQYHVIKYKNAYYILVYGKLNLPYRVLDVSPNLMLSNHCTFERTETKTSLIVGNREPVCQRKVLDKVSDLPFSGENNVRLEKGRRFFGMQPEIGSTLVDIDNDGRKEKVIKLIRTIGNGRTCDTEFFAVTDDTGAFIPETYVNSRLLGMDECLGGSGNVLGIFSYRGTNYIDAGGVSHGGAIYRFADDKFHKICQFKSRGQVKVVDTKFYYNPPKVRCEPENDYVECSLDRF